MKTIHYYFFGLIFLLTLSCAAPPPEHSYDIVLTNAMIYDGSGEKPYEGSVAITGKKIAAVGDIGTYEADTVIDVQGKAISPGFINMLSWAAYPLLEDGRSMSGIKQGVTLEVFGEGSSLGPASEYARENNEQIRWRTFGEALEYMVEQGVAPNVASFVGATTIRVHELGYEDRAPNAEELKRMQGLVRQAMEEGALGLGTSLIYAPAFYADTDELIALAKVAAEYDGKYISHLRSEGDSFIEAVQELLTISEEANIDAEIYHLKAAGRNNWQKLDQVLAMIDSVNADGQKVTANMYNYVAASTGLDATMPPWVQEGGTKEWIKRLRNPKIKAQVIEEMQYASKAWENFLVAAGDPDNILLVEFEEDSLKYLTGKTAGEISEMRGTEAAETIIDLVVQNGGDIGTVYFLMNEDNVKKQIQLPFMTFGSDARSIAAEGKNLESSTHPRTYGNFARLLGKYVREEKVIPLEEAIHKLTLLSAQKLKIEERGKLDSGYYADVVVFDPEIIADKATFENPHQYAVGVEHVFVNGTQVLNEGEHTGATPGMFVRGPGYQEDKEEAAVSSR
ncbi:N-acyl-D-amino-acid deacylase [Catalinimonas alkaloidigena]|uniref:N-acyl-D-amino-acid deacylase family protein n=1 Tax=Catalinimonas alkaloidigena TaxID=1075417 RepID=UPI002405DB93|nr:D-aminoacylase [Catalinimonas alkaloidigena]MDF9800333.1 N-acyl-D-amino-acid deacylase [Catalinimonas alkaloidigena]